MSLETQIKKRLYWKQYRLKNKDKRNLDNKRYKLKNKDKIKASRRHQRFKEYYNLTLDAYNKILIKQEYKCACCGIDLKLLSTKDIHVDHCHKTLKIRGILCRWCNWTLGASREEIHRLKSAIQYLQKH